MTAATRLSPNYKPAMTPNVKAPRRKQLHSGDRAPQSPQLKDPGPRPTIVAVHTAGGLAVSDEVLLRELRERIIAVTAEVTS